MLTLNSLTVSSFNVDQLTLTWDFKPSKEFFSAYGIDVYRAESPNEEAASISGYELIASGIGADTYSYTDTSITNLYDPYRKWYYKLHIYEIATPANDSIQPSLPAYVNDSSTNKAYKEILRRKKKVLDRFVGRDLTILKRRTYGTYCTVCFDEVLFRSTDSNCPTCWGTGFLQGYFDPISVRGMINAAPKYNQITMFGEFLPSDAVLNILNYPPLRPRDVIVDNINRRWLVRQIRPLEKDGVLIEQSVQISLISPDDYVYQISIGT